MIGVVLLTCDRPKERKGYALACLKSLVHLDPGEPMMLHIADDGSGHLHVADLMEVASKMGCFIQVTRSDSGGRGYGASYNAATQVVHDHADLILPLEDDWELTRPFDLRPIATVLREGLFACVRLGYIGWTQDLNAKFVGSHGLTWLALDPASPEPHVFSGHPRLETREYERRVGLWPEMLSAGQTEFEVAHLPEARVGVGWPVDLVKPIGDLFGHIGALGADVAEVISRA